MIIAFTGKAGAGKSTAAGMLIDIAITALFYEKVVPVSFAEPIKRIARTHFDWDGRKDGKGRRLLQVLGTEAGRAYDPDRTLTFQRYFSGLKAGRAGSRLLRSAKGVGRRERHG